MSRWLRDLRSFLRSPRRWISPASLTLGTIVAVMALFAAEVPILELIELKTYDLRFVSRGPRPPSGAVVLAAIDEKSLDVEGRWPWPRSRMAALVDLLARDGAKVIGFDIAFSEPDENSRLALVDGLAQQLEALRIEDARLRRFVDEQRRDADNDRAFAQAIRRSTATVVLGYFFHMSAATLEYRLEPDEIERRLQRVAGSEYSRVSDKGRGGGRRPFLRAYAPESNLAMFSEAATSSGYFSLQSDRDGVLRTMPLVIEAGDMLLPPLPLLCAWHYLDRPSLTLEVGRHGVDGVRLGDRFIPTDGTGRVMINYPGPPKTFPHVSVTDILRGNVAPGTFAGRIVLVGSTAVGTYDLRSTPFSPIHAGLEVHAAVIGNLLDGDVIARPEWSTVFDLLAIVGLAAAIWVALSRLSPLPGLLGATALFLGYVLLGRWLFARTGHWLNMVYPLAALTLTYVALTIHSYVTERRERIRVRDRFRQYVAPLVVEEVLKTGGNLKLGGDERELTVLFSDLEGFTTYAERYSPAEMTAMLGEYYDGVTEEVFRYRGTLKEYIGDELFAFFGAPLPTADHAQRACSAALAMRDRTAALAAAWASVGRPRIRARTGINSGPMLVGNLGSRYRFAYGVLGDQVNLGSRLEGLNKEYGTDILIGENTARLVGGAFLLREVDMVRVKGRDQAVRVYELLGLAGAATSVDDTVLRIYAEALEAYRNGRWAQARALFGRALSLRRHDGPCRTMAARCEAYEKAPPPEPWDGVFDQLVK